jgi:hypothetical protein
VALINLNIKNFKKDLGGIANRLVDKAVNKVEQKFENAVEDAFAKGLKKIGLSDSVAGQLSARFGDAFSNGRADDFFKSSTSEQNRVSPKEIEQRLLAGASETTLDAVQKIKDASIANPTVMQFPDQMGQYYMSLDFQSYSRPSPQMEALFNRFRTILLPIPRDLKENFDLDIDSKAQGALAGGLADLGTDLLRGAGSAVSGTEFAILYGAIAQKFEGSAADALGQALGAVPNPHLQALFQGVQLRNHTFQWTFAPRNPQESKNLKAIINEIKKNSMPAYSTTGTAALLYPPMVEVKLMPWGNDLIRFKKCLIKGVSVNYAPSGLPSFFKPDSEGVRHPTMIQLELQLVETEIQTAKDYGLQPGERDDGLEQFKDAVAAGAERMGLSGTIDTFNQTKDKFYSDVSSSASSAAANRQAGVRKQ